MSLSEFIEVVYLCGVLLSGSSSSGILAFIQEDVCGCLDVLGLDLFCERSREERNASGDISIGWALGKNRVGSCGGRVGFCCG